jgi:hypothetical protein
MTLRDNINTESSARIPNGESARMDDLYQRLETLLRHVSEALKRNNLPTIDRAEIRECVLALEQMKMLMSELELLNRCLCGAREQSPT